MSGWVIGLGPVGGFVWLVGVLLGWLALVWRGRARGGRSRESGYRGLNRGIEDQDVVVDCTARLEEQVVGWHPSYRSIDRPDTLSRGSTRNRRV